MTSTDGFGVVLGRMENNFHLAPDSSSEEHEPPMMSSRLPARLLCGGGKNLPCSVVVKPRGVVRCGC